VLFQAGGQVERVAGSHGRTPERVTDDHLAGLDPDPHLEHDAVALGCRRRQLDQRIADGKCGPNRALGVVLWACWARTGPSPRRH
jgi:hypothetical protein